jgi:uncharacterized protein (TIGR03067 family)
MDRHLPSRPNLGHLRQQAKALLSDLKEGNAAAARAFIEHLPAAVALTPAKVRAAGLRLADAQSVIARKSGFSSWPSLARHVDTLRALEGAWQFVALEVDGAAMPPAAVAASRILMDGDCFRVESPEATYEGVFTINAETEPRQIDIEFVEGPEAGNWSYGIFELAGDQLTICLGLTRASRPVAFATAPDRGHALERLRRVSRTRPAAVTGGTPRATRRGADASTPPGSVETRDFDMAMTPLLERLQGEWQPTGLIRDGQEMPSEWLGFGSRVTTGNEVRVVFGGQTMVHAKMRLDETASPIAVNYMALGSQGGVVSLGIMDWAGDEARFLIAAPGQPRPRDFASLASKGLTFSQWRRK